jgi:predicted ATP-dependent endonuclease of OLD family
VLVTTHSPEFISRNFRDITSLCRMHKQDGITHAYQVTPGILENALNENIGLYRRFSEMLRDPEVDDSLKETIRNKGLGEDDPDLFAKLQDEAIRYFLWIDAERATLFFAKRVVICEGASEKLLLDYLVDTRWSDLRERHVYFVNAGGKFDIHRYISLLDSLGVPHAVLMDGDDNQGYQQVVNDFIEEHRKPTTLGVHSFETNLEAFLGIDSPPRRDLKPVHVMKKLQDEKIGQDKITALRKIIDGLLADPTG